ncbi:MAG: hypothetical protein WAX85_03260 [Minisyncoccia bacterium]
MISLVISAFLCILIWLPYIPGLRSFRVWFLLGTDGLKEELQEKEDKLQDAFKKRGYWTERFSEELAKDSPVYAKDLIVSEIRKYEKEVMKCHRKLDTVIGMAYLAGHGKLASKFVN